MVDIAQNKTKDAGRIRILSLDGGGIYGLTGAIWMRRLCEGNPRFLDGSDIDLFAGTSSGAINALLLARHQVPREAVLAGELERFWTNPRPFSNSRRVLRALSNLGVTGWFSDIDLLDALRETFGDTELGDLPHHVHISAFNWTGAGGKPTSRAGQGSRHWRPKFFANIIGDDEDFDDPVAEIAYAAATPPMFRPMRNGLGDGASFNGNPVVSAIAQVVKSFYADPNGDLRVHRTRANMMSWPHTPEHVGHMLGSLALISVGSGQQLPYYALGNIDLGQLFATLPSNPFIGVLWPPIAYAIDPATEEAEFIAKQLIGRHRALRLNPATIAVPTIVASLLARNPWARDRIIQQLYWATANERALDAIQATLEFMADPDSWGRPP